MKIIKGLFWVCFAVAALWMLSLFLKVAGVVLAVIGSMISVVLHLISAPWIWALAAIGLVVFFWGRRGDRRHSWRREMQALERDMERLNHSLKSHRIRI
ncbi:MAG: hypothetical protein KDC35_15545 [Acidobacteria bacterium]|nr:hypothetical protein [Acidobacteriota bacterium]